MFNCFLHPNVELCLTPTSLASEKLVGKSKSFRWLLYLRNQHSTLKDLVPPRASDPGWAHGIMVNGGRQKIKCKYCHKVMLGGGISRLKQHLAGERGNVAPCEEVPEEVKVHIQQHLGLKVLEKLKKQKGGKSGKQSASHIQSRESEEDNTDDQQQIPKTRRGSSWGREDTSNRTKRRKKQNFPTPISSFVITQAPSQNPASQESIDQADMAVARFVYEAGIPFTVANSPYFQKMADAIAAVGSNYKMPSYQSLRGKLLNKSVKDAGGYCEELKKSWETTGCSVMVDRWTDQTGRTVLNFYVYCPKGTMFIKSIDASRILQSAEALFNLFDSVVQEVGPKNIVNFVIDSSPCCKTAGKLLTDIYKTFFCSICAGHCVELMLEEIGKMEEVKEVVGKAKRITQFIYNHSWVLSLMRKKTGGRDIIQIATTRFISIFSTIQSMVSLKYLLHQMFTSNAWMHSNFSKERTGIEVAEIIVDPLFWSRCDHIQKVAKPLLSILQTIDCEEKPTIGYVYDAMEKAKRNVIMAFNNMESDYLPYLKVIDNLWHNEFASPLYAAAYYLNPSLFYSPNFSSSKVIQKGFLDCIETLEPDIALQVSITNNINFYEEAAGDFGRPVALLGRETLAPATWWSLYASDYPDLQKLAVRILSQACSIPKCDRNRNIHEHIHSKKRNQIENQRLDDLFFVHYNLHLQERRSEAGAWATRGTVDPICLEAMETHMGDWVEQQGLLEVKENGWVGNEHFVNLYEVNLDVCNGSIDGRASEEEARVSDGNDNL